MFATEKASQNNTVDAHNHHHQQQHQGFQPANFTTGIKDDLSERKHQHLRFMTDLFPRQQSRVAPKRQVGAMAAQQQHGFLRAAVDNGDFQQQPQRGKASAFHEQQQQPTGIEKVPMALRVYNHVQPPVLQKPVALKPLPPRFGAALRNAKLEATGAATAAQQLQQQWNAAPNENRKPLQQQPPVLANDLKNACHFADLKARRGALKAVAASPTVSKSSSLLFERQLIEDDDPFAGPPMAGFEDEEVFQIDL